MRYFLTVLFLLFATMAFADVLPISAQKPVDEYFNAECENPINWTALELQVDPFAENDELLDLNSLVKLVDIQMEYQLKKKEIQIVVSYEDPVCLSLISELTKDWRTRINPVVLNSMDEKAKQQLLQTMDRYNHRLKFIHDHFDITFVDYHKATNVDGFPMMRFGHYATKWQQLPSETKMRECGRWLGLFEWMATWWHYPQKEKQWKSHCRFLAKNYYEEEKKRRQKFANDFMAAHPGEYQSGTSYGVYKKLKTDPNVEEEDYDDDDPEGYAHSTRNLKFISLNSLGYKKEPYPRYPVVPDIFECPVEGFKIE